MTTYEKLRLAMTSRRQVVARYQEHRREFCPHVLGTGKGEAKILGFQFGGEGSEGPILSPSDGEWRCFVVAQLESIEIRDGEWFTRASHTNAQTCVAEIDLDVRS